MLFASCSPFVRELFEKSSENCTCETMTLLLPDFDAATVKNLLSILYTGTSIGDCSLSELKRLLETLRIDIKNLSVKSHQDGNKEFPAAAAAAGDVEEPSAAGAPTNTTSLAALANKTTSSDDENDEMLEVTPEVQMFFGNHFLATGENGTAENSENEDNSNNKDPAGNIAGSNASANAAAAAVNKTGEASDGEVDAAAMVEQSMARHQKELSQMTKFQQHLENGLSASPNGPNGNGNAANTNSANNASATSASSDLAAAAAALSNGLQMLQQQQGGGGVDPSVLAAFGGNGGFRMYGDEASAGEGKSANYSCRLCGKVSGNGASLFAHLLYPHYAHLWRDDVPHRAPRYDCRQCSYTTAKRQHFVMHVARVHDELRKKLDALGENLEVLDNLTQKSQSSKNSERIISKVAKGINPSDDAFHANQQAASDMSDSQIKTEDGAEGDAGVGDDMNPHKMFGFEPQQQQQQQQQQPPPQQHQPFQNSTGSRFPRGVKPFVKCRLCGKSWKGKDNFFTHLVSTHFKYLWAKEVPKQADMFHCHVRDCTYQSKYRYNFLFHLAGKHKQLRQKLAEEGIPQNVLIPIETDEVAVPDDQAAAMAAGMVNPSDLLRQSKMLMQQQRRMTTPPAAMKGSPGSSSPAAGRSSQNNTRLICRVCSKVSLNHTCHRQHVVGKHFYEFWAHLTADGMGIFNCHHPECTYKTPNRSVFIIHLAYVHQELKNKLIASGKDPNCATPDVYGKRKYRRAFYDNTQHQFGSFSNMATASSPGFGSPNSNNISASSPSSTSSATDQVCTFKCSVCKAEFGKHRAVVEHLALSHFHHVWDENSGGPFTVASAGPYVCQHCPFNSSSRQTFICHIVSQHEALKHVLAIQFDGQRTVSDLIETIGAANGSGNSGGMISGSDDQQPPVLQQQTDLSDSSPNPGTSGGGGVLAAEVMDEDEVEDVEDEEEEGVAVLDGDEDVEEEFNDDEMDLSQMEMSSTVTNDPQNNDEAAVAASNLAW